MITQLVILAGGQGTRLRSVTGDLPKPMALVDGTPVLEHQVRSAARLGFTEVVFLTSYRSEIIEKYFGDGTNWGVHFRYLMDETPLGTAGATLSVLDQLDDRFLLVYGDVMHDVDLRYFADFHENKEGAGATLFVHPNDHPQDSDVIEMDGTFRIKEIHGYPHERDSWYRNIVNAGLYALSKEALIPYAGRSEKIDFAKNLFPEMLRDAKPLYGYFSREYIKDMGTPDRLLKVSRHQAEGRISAYNRNNPVPAVFLDRDGTIIRYQPFLSKAEDVELLPGAAEALRLLNASGFLAVLITNQPIIARGECTFAELERIHGRMEHLLAMESRCYLDAIYFCPHHPHSGFDGEIPELKIPCSCRKPNTGMIDRASVELNIDLANSWFIGDSIRDWETALKAGIKPLFVSSGEDSASSHKKISADSVFPNLMAAVRHILE